MNSISTSCYQFLVSKNPQAIDKALEKTGVSHFSQYLLETCGQFYQEELRKKFPLMELHQKMQFNQKLLVDTHERLKSNKFKDFINSCAGKLPFYSETTVYELGNNSLTWMHFLPWMVQQLKSIERIEKCWQGLDISVFIEDKEKFEEKQDQALVEFLDEGTAPKDPVTLEKYILSKGAIFRQSKEIVALPLATLVREWLSSSTVKKIEEVIKTFPLIEVFEAPKLDGKESKGQKEEKTFGQKKFSEFRIFRLLESISESLSISNFSLRDHYSQEFYQGLFNQLQKSERHRGDAVYFAGKLTYIPSDSPLKSFLDTCQLFLLLKKKAHFKTNGSFVLEWIYDARQEDRNLSSFSIYDFQEDEEYVRQLVEKLKIHKEDRFFIFLSLINLKNLEGFEVFSQQIAQKEIFRVENNFVVALFRKKFNPLDWEPYPEVCQQIQILVRRCAKGSFESADFWCEICLSIQKAGAEKIQTYLQDFKTTIGSFLETRRRSIFQYPPLSRSPSSDQDEKHSPRQPLDISLKQLEKEEGLAEIPLNGNLTALENDYQLMMLSFLNNHFSRLYLTAFKELINRLDQLKMVFSLNEEYQFLSRISQFSFLKEFREEKDLKVDSKIDQKGNLATEIESPKRIIQVVEAAVKRFSFSKEQMTQLFIEYLNNSGMLEKQLLLLSEITDLVNEPLETNDLFNWLIYCPSFNQTAAIIKAFKDYRQEMIKILLTAKQPPLSLNEKIQELQVRLNTMGPEKKKPSWEHSHLETFIEIPKMMTFSLAPTTLQPITDFFKKEFLDHTTIEQDTLLFFKKKGQTGKAFYRKWLLPQEKDQPYLIAEVSLINFHTQETLTFRAPLQIPQNAFKTNPKMLELLYKTALEVVENKEGSAFSGLEKELGASLAKHCTALIKKLQQAFQIGVLCLALPPHEKMREQLIALCKNHLILENSQLETHAYPKYEQVVSEIVNLINSKKPIEKKEFFFPFSFYLNFQPVIEIIENNKKEDQEINEVTFTCGKTTFPVRYPFSIKNSPNFPKTIRWQLLTFLSRISIAKETTEEKKKN